MAHTPPSRQDLPRRPPRPVGDLAALRQEFEHGGVGALILREVEYAAHQLVPRYNAAVYSEIGNWRHGLADLVQDVVANSLLRDRQAAYMLDVAATIDDFRRLLARQIRRQLARRRTRTVIDNILGRARPILAEPPFERRVRHLKSTFCLAGANVEDRAATYRELCAGADALRSVPQQGSSSRDRAPMVFTTPDLRTALRRMSASLPVAFTIGELDRALRLALPHFLPSVLDSDDRMHEPVDVGEIDWTLVEHCARAVLHRLDMEACGIVALKVASVSDAEIGTLFGLTRRTATNRKAVAFAVLEELLHPLTQYERLGVLDAIGPSLDNALAQLTNSDVTVVSRFA